MEVFAYPDLKDEFWDQYRELDDVTDVSHHEQKFRDGMLTDQTAYVVTHRAAPTFAAWLALKSNIQSIASIVQNQDQLLTEQDLREWNQSLKNLTKKIDVLKQLTMNSLDKTQWKKDRDQYEAELYDDAREGWVKK